LSGTETAVEIIDKAGLNEAAAAGILYLSGWPAVAEEGAQLVYHVAFMPHQAAGKFL
jgi:hypothetical protein